MSKAVVRMEKQKATTLSAIQRHVERTSDKHGNRDIDITKSHLNLDMLADKQLNQEIKPIRKLSQIAKDTGYQSRIEYWLKSLTNWQTQNQRPVQRFRKDAVRVVDFVVTSDQAFFADLTSEQTTAYFRDATRFFIKRYHYPVFAEVHLDETTPHMHLGVVPITKTSDKGYRLSAKTLFDRKELINLQTEFVQAMQAQGWAIERGQERSTAKHLDTPAFKQQQTIFNQPFDDVLLRAQDVIYRDVEGKFLPSKQFNQLVNQSNRYRDYEALKRENERLTNRVNNQQTANKHLRRERNLLNVTLQEQKDHNARLDKHIDWLSNRVDWLEKALAVTKKVLGRLRDRLKKLNLVKNRVSQQTEIDAELTQLFQDDQVTDEHLKAELRQQTRIAPKEKTKTITRENEFYFDLPRDSGPSRGR